MSDTVRESSSPSHVDFDIIPTRALRGGPGRLSADALVNTPWWQGVPLPPEFRSWLDGIAKRDPSRAPPSEMWGEAGGNRIEVISSDGGATTNILARVDVRRLDARFGAALLVLVRQLGATLVRRDGVIVEPTIGAFGAALRGTAAWRSANDPATWLAAQSDDPDD